MSDELAPVAYQGEHSEDDLELFGPYRHLLPIFIHDRRFEVPEGNSVLRALQFVEIKQNAVRMAWRDYCWNNTTGCCEMRYRETPDGPVRVARACQVRVRPGLSIVELPPGGRCWGWRPKAK